jgi:hypothetical protein
MADLKLVIPKFTGSLGRSGVSSGDYSVSDIRQLQRALKALDPKLRTQLLREAKEPAKPIQAAIKSAIPAVAPLSGMTAGRLSWEASRDGKGKAHKAKDVKIQFRTSSSGKSNVTSLVRVRVASPAVVFADMAGRSGRYMGAGYRGSGVTRPYPYKGGVRVHHVDGKGAKKPGREYKFARQGDALLKGLGGSASRYVWPAAERSIPAAREAVDRVITKFAQMVNKKGL